MNEINAKKEKAFEERKKAGEQIRGKISEIKGFKQSRDNITTNVKEHKAERDKRNTTVKGLVKKLKELEDERNSIIKKHNLKGDPFSIKKDIERLEYKQQTEPMSFDKEKKLMDNIRELKAKYKKLDSITSVSKQIQELKKEINSLRKEADLFHKQIQAQAKQGQEKHVSLLDNSNEINELKKAEKEAEERFLELKKEITDINTKLKQHLDALGKLYDKLNLDKTELKELKKEKIQKSLEEKRKEVDLKLKQGKKLTTEDIIAFQSQM